MQKPARAREGQSLKGGLDKRFGKDKKKIKHSGKTKIYRRK